MMYSQIELHFRYMTPMGIRLDFLLEQLILRILQNISTQPKQSFIQKAIPYTMPIELDWLPGRFFDDSRRYLICATHGALYAPDSGRCVAGPCQNGRLEVLPVVERDGGVFLVG